MGYFNDQLIPLIEELEDVFKENEIAKFTTKLKEDCTVGNLPNVFLHVIDLARKVVNDVRQLRISTCVPNLETSNENIDDQKIGAPIEVKSQKGRIKSTFLNVPVEMDDHVLSHLCENNGIQSCGKANKRLLISATKKQINKGTLNLPPSNDLLLILQNLPLSRLEQLLPIINYKDLIPFYGKIDNKIFIETLKKKSGVIEDWDFQYNGYSRYIIPKTISEHVLALRLKMDCYQSIEEEINMIALQCKNLHSIDIISSQEFFNHRLHSTYCVTTRSSRLASGVMKKNENLKIFALSCSLLGEKITYKRSLANKIVAIETYLL